jgi:hypothetical protein
LKKALFVCYGSGHVRMVVPVASALRDSGMAHVQVLGLTTAAPVVRAAGLELLQFKDFVGESPRALERGRELVAAMDSVVDVQESEAYLGLCYEELVNAVGEQEAARRYARDGRQAFLPCETLERILATVRPDLLVATNSPRAEQAAVLAAGRLGIPSVCMVDLFAVDEVRWIGAPDYASRVCVLNEHVKQFLVNAGRHENQVIVTGNPAFDVLSEPGWADEGAALRQTRGWERKRVLLWPTQVEPAFHPFDGRPADSSLPQRVLAALVDWVLGRQDAILCVRPRAGEAPPALPQDRRIVITGQDWPLPKLLHAVNTVVTLNSTVALEGFLSGTRVIQVLGSVFDEAMPLSRFGMADAAVPLAALQPALERWTAMPRRATSEGLAATSRVVAVLREFL